MAESIVHDGAVEIHLARMLGFEVAHFQIHDDEAAQAEVVEKEAEVKLAVADGEAVLAAHSSPSKNRAPSTSPVSILTARHATPQALSMAKPYINNRSFLAILILVALCATVKAEKPIPMPGYQHEMVKGWHLYISDRLLQENKAAVATAMPLLEKQLAEIIRVVPGPAVEKLKETCIFFTLPANGTNGTAEYHDDAGWLRDNGRDPAMAKGVQVSAVADFAKETDRMPAFVLHELAHSYHDKVLKWDQPDIIASYEHAKAAKLYDRVECWHGTGTPNTFQRAYAMTDPKEYFAELTESYFVRNDFFPFNRAELAQHDPQAFAVLQKVWGVQ